MFNQEVGAGAKHTPTLENSATLYSNDSKLYISNPSIVDDLQQLRNEQVVRDFANVTPETYELIKATNPTLLLFVDLAKRIMEAEG